MAKGPYRGENRESSLSCAATSLHRLCNIPKHDIASTIIKAFEGLPLVSASQIRKSIPSEYKSQYRRKNALKRRKRHTSSVAALVENECHNSADKEILHKLCEDIKAVGSGLLIHVVARDDKIVRLVIDASKDCYPLVSEDPSDLTENLILIENADCINEELPSLRQQLSIREGLTVLDSSEDKLQRQRK